MVEGARLEIVCTFKAYLGFKSLTLRHLISTKFFFDMEYKLLKEVKRMKENIHPKYEKTTITCACGEVIETCSTKENIRVEICSKCHPFFTGRQKLVDTGGRVDRFNKRFGIKEGK